MAKSIYLTSFDIDTIWSVIFKKRLINFLDELGNFKQKNSKGFEQ